MCKAGHVYNTLFIRDGSKLSVSAEFAVTESCKREHARAKRSLCACTAETVSALVELNGLYVLELRGDVTGVVEDAAVTVLNVFNQVGILHCPIYEVKSLAGSVLVGIYKIVAVVTRDATVLADKGKSFRVLVKVCIDTVNKVKNNVFSVFVNCLSTGLCTDLYPAVFGCDVGEFGRRCKVSLLCACNECKRGNHYNNHSENHRNLLDACFHSAKIPFVKYIGRITNNSVGQFYHFYSVLSTEITAFCTHFHRIVNYRQIAQGLFCIFPCSCFVSVPEMPNKFSFRKNKVKDSKYIPHKA